MILWAVCLEQDFGKESVEERETEVMTEKVEASLEEVDAMKKDFSLFWKTLLGKELEANFDHTILVGKWSKKRNSKTIKLIEWVRNSKAMKALFCALDKKTFRRVSSCESAQEIWNKLEVVYEGTNQVKESKISRYTKQYELFQMEQNESVYSMYIRFMNIVNTLRALGKKFSNREKVKKLLSHF